MPKNLRLTISINDAELIRRTLDRISYKYYPNKRPQEMLKYVEMAVKKMRRQDNEDLSLALVLYTTELADEFARGVYSSIEDEIPY